MMRRVIRPLPRITTPSTSPISEMMVSSSVAGAMRTVPTAFSTSTPAWCIGSYSRK